jgi:hypothetical protein
LLREHFCHQHGMNVNAFELPERKSTHRYLVGGGTRLAGSWRHKRGNA